MTHQSSLDRIHNTPFYPLPSLSSPLFSVSVSSNASHSGGAGVKHVLVTSWPNAKLRPFKRRPSEGAFVPYIRYILPTSCQLFSTFTGTLYMAKSKECIGKFFPWPSLCLLSLSHVAWTSVVHVRIDHTTIHVFIRRHILQLHLDFSLSAFTYQYLHALATVNPRYNLRVSHKEHQFLNHSDTCICQIIRQEKFLCRPLAWEGSFDTCQCSRMSLEHSWSLKSTRLRRGALASFGSLYMQTRVQTFWWAGVEHVLVMTEEVALIIFGS